MALAAIRVGIVYQIDPAGPVTGGIDSVIRGEAKWAPADMQVKIIGLSTDPSARPPGRWTEVKIGDRSVPFFPVGVDPAPMMRKGIPLSVRLAWGALRYRAEILRSCDVLEFHRIEAALPLMGARRGRNTIVHQNMAVLKQGKADIRWKRLPALYFALERRFMHAMDSVFCVRSDACEDYRQRFPSIAERFRFLPTWMDTDLFFPRSGDARREARAEMATRFGVSAGARVLIAVGRLDHQKNPLLLIDAFARVAGAQPDTVLIVVGEGVLRPQVEQRIAELGLGSRVVLAGLQPPAQIARMLSASDLYVMSSAYEGMPISVLEAMACGLPVVSTRVGEVGRVVVHGNNGMLVDDHTPQALAEAIEAMLARPLESAGRAAIEAVKPYVPGQVLQPVFQAYRLAARRAAASS